MSSHLINPRPPPGGPSAENTELRPACGRQLPDLTWSPSGQPASVEAWYPVGVAADLRRSPEAALLGRSLRVARDRATGLWFATDVATGVLVPCVERHDLVWVCSAASEALAPTMIEFPGPRPPRLLAAAAVETVGDFDQAVLGLVDPAHVPMVHTSWWWRPKSKARRIKTKAYSPSPYGFTARAVDRFRSAPAYRLAGEAPDVTIEFRLPGVRVERITSAAGRLINMTTITPKARCVHVIRNVIYGDLGWLALLRWPVEALARSFLRQDARLLSLLQDHDTPHRHLFVGDPDMPSLWYFALKRELLASQYEGRAFHNPVLPRSLSWRT